MQVERNVIIDLHSSQSLVITEILEEFFAKLKLLKAVPPHPPLKHQPHRKSAPLRFAFPAILEVALVQVQFANYYFQQQRLC